MTSASPLRVLVTGAAGAIGRPVCAELARRGDFVRAFDREPPDPQHEVVIGELADASAVRSAVEGVDAIVHLAAIPNDAPFTELLGPNVLGLFHVLDAARAAGVRRVLLASSLQVGGKSDAQLTSEDKKPNNHYALTKLWAEDMGEMYARRFGLEIVAARFGWMVRSPREARRMEELRYFHLYLSRADVADFCYRAIRAPFSGFAALFVIGADGHERFDLEPARRLFDWVPRDRWPDGLPFAIPSE